MIRVFSDEAFWAFVGINVLLAWGLYVMAATGQLSLGQAGFAAVGAYTASYATVALGWPLEVALLIGAVGAAVVAFPVAAGASRVRGVVLIIGTMAAGEVIRVGISTIDQVGGVEGYFGMGGVGLAQVATSLTIVLVGLVVLSRGRLGVVARAIRDDEDAAASLGVGVRRVKVAAVVVGAAITGLAGGLSAHYLAFIRPDHFGVSESFAIALFVLIGGRDNLLGPAVGAFVLTYLPEAFRVFDEYRGVINGAVLLGVVILSPPGLITSARLRRVRRAVRRRLRRRRAGVAPSRGAAREVPTEEEPFPVVRVPNGSGPALEVTGLSKRFSGLTALDGVDLAVQPGQVLGLIGPNGAGKSTLINVASGLLRPSAGRVALWGNDVTDLPAHRRAGMGLARTFQAVRLFPALTVGEHLRLAERNAADRPGAPGAPVSAAAARARLLRALDLQGDRDRLAGALPLGARRRLQIAACLAGGPSVLLLDEPSVGLDATDLEEVAAVVRQVRDGGAAVLLVDHNLDLVTILADRVAVIDFGRKIAEGTMEEVRRDGAVRVAYLGTADDVTEAGR